MAAKFKCLMRSLKTTGGLIRGMGFSETQRLLWVSSMPACAEIDNSVQQLTDVKYSTGEQLKDVTYSRVASDSKDTQEVLVYLSQISPFTAEASLRNIANGVTGPPSVNSTYTNLRLLEIVSWPLWRGNQLPHTYSGKKDQAVTMETNSSIKIQDEHVHADQQLLFQRLVIIGTNNGELQNLFDHELCQYPPALFDSVD